MRKTAGQTVYVLMSLEGNAKNKEWRPVAVVTNPDLANQWYEYGQNVDWVPLELDDIKSISPDNMPTFHPRQTTPGEQKAVDMARRMEEVIKRMQTVIEEQQKTIKKLQRGHKSSKSKASLLRKKE